jgi:hypothetical protein
MSQELQLDILRVNYAIAAWAWTDIETELFYIYWFVTGAHENYDALKAAFFAVLGFEIRLSMTSAAAKRTLTTTLLAEWDHLREKIDKHRRERNRIAHRGGLIVTQEGKPDLVVLLEDPSHPKHPPTYTEAKNQGIDALKLRAFAEDWIVLKDSMSQFYKKLLTQLSKSS